MGNEGNFVGILKIFLLTICLFSQIINIIELYFTIIGLNPVIYLIFGDYKWKLKADCDLHFPLLNRIKMELKVDRRRKRERRTSLSPLKFSIMLIKSIKVTQK